MGQPDAELINMTEFAHSRSALDSISFPGIDRAFIGDDSMRRFAYRSFFTRNVFVKA